MVLIYYNPSTETSTAWYPVRVWAQEVFTKWYLIYQASVSPAYYFIALRTNKPDGSGAYASALTFTKIRVFIVPAILCITRGTTGCAG